MTTMRKVMLTIEVNTVLSTDELKDLQALVFGRLRSDKHSTTPRLTIKRVMPTGMNHDVRGVIVQVQTNVVKEKAGKKRAVAKAS